MRGLKRPPTIRFGLMPNPKKLRYAGMPGHRRFGSINKGRFFDYRGDRITGDPNARTRRRRWSPSIAPN